MTVSDYKAFFSFFFQIKTQYVESLERIRLSWVKLSIKNGSNAFKWNVIARKDSSPQLTVKGGNPAVRVSMTAPSIGRKWERKKKEEEEWPGRCVTAPFPFLRLALFHLSQCDNRWWKKSRPPFEAGDISAWQHII